MTIKQAKTALVAVCRPKQLSYVGDSLEWQTSPIVSGKFVCATDGRIAAMIATDDAADVAPLPLTLEAYYAAKIRALFNDLRSYPFRDFDRLALDGALAAFSADYTAWLNSEKREIEDALRDAKPCPHCGKLLITWQGEIRSIDKTPSVDPRYYDVEPCVILDDRGDAQIVVNMMYLYLALTVFDYHKGVEPPKVEILPYKSKSRARSMLCLSSSTRGIYIAIMPIVFPKRQASSAKYRIVVSAPTAKQEPRHE